MQVCPHKRTDFFIHFDPHRGWLHRWALYLGGGRLSWDRFGTQNYNDDQILADFKPLVSRRHTVKRLIIHYNIIPPWPPEPKLVLIIPTSKSECKFASLSVHGPDGPIALAILVHVGLNAACADPCTLPTSFVITWGTVRIGLTLGDLVAGLILIIFDALVDVLISVVSDKLSDMLPNGLLKMAILTEKRIPGLSNLFLNAAVFTEIPIVNEIIGDIVDTFLSESVDFLGDKANLNQKIDGFADYVGNNTNYIVDTIQSFDGAKENLDKMISDWLQGESDSLTLPKEDLSEVDISDMKDKALLCEHVYGREGAELPDGTKELGDWRVDEIGFHAKLYEMSDGRKILVFEGTDPKSVVDWVNNVQQGLGLDSEQYDMAIKLSTQLADIYPDIEFAGHSLGGGQAAASGIATDRPVTTFNAAGVHENTIQNIDYSQTNLSDRLENINNFYVPSEILTTAQELSPMYNAAGNQYQLPDVNSLSSVEKHGVDGLDQSTNLIEK